jgi:D-alanine-D-alanine ligase
MDAKKTARSTSPRTLGPVSDLERHLPSDWWRTLFNSIYLKTDGDVVEHEGNTARDVDLLIRAAVLEPNDRILDLCCGQGRHCLELAKRGFRQISGLDRSRYLIRLAKKRARQLGLNVAFHEGDARKFRLPENFFRCVVVFGNSFGYFEREDDDRAVLESIKRVLIPEGTLAMDLVDGEWMRTNYEPRSWEWIDQNQFVCRERSLANGSNRLVSREVVVHAEHGVIADQFYAERLYTKDTIKELLENVGFSNIRHQGAVPTESDRNQDLGMMAHRMFLTAKAPGKVVAITKTKVAYPDITVLLGDPIMPDATKRDGQFNEEDFETIDRLKSALSELDGYRIDYVNNHASLLADLKANPPSFVVNFCDEGFYNDAFKELHVPAILEMLDIPYTGAGPACLGLCYNKAIVRAIAMTLDIPVPLETYYGPEDQMASIPSVFPALLKPNFGDSSIGITKDAVVSTTNELMAYLQELRESLPGIPVLIQEFLSGPEYSVGIIGNPGLSYHILPVLEVDYSGLDPELPRILGYESKWLPDSAYWNQVKFKETENIDEETRRKLMDYSNLLFERLGCRDYARFDFRTDSNGEIKLLEANPNPGWCWDGKFNIMAGFEGLRYADMLRMVLEAAQERVAAKEHAVALAISGV